MPQKRPHKRHDPTMDEARRYTSFLFYVTLWSIVGLVVVVPVLVLVARCGG